MAKVFVFGKYQMTCITLAAGRICYMLQFLIIPVSETFFPPSSFTASFCVTGGWEGEGRAPDKSDISDD